MEVAKMQEPLIRATGNKEYRENYDRVFRERARSNSNKIIKQNKQK